MVWVSEGQISYRFTGFGTISKPPRLMESLHQILFPCCCPFLGPIVERRVVEPLTNGCYRACELHIPTPPFSLRVRQMATQRQRHSLRTTVASYRWKCIRAPFGEGHKWLAVLFCRGSNTILRLISQLIGTLGGGFHHSLQSTI